MTYMYGYRKTSKLKKMSKEIDNVILKNISHEIETKHDCKVVSISFCEIIGTLNVQFKIKFNEDVLYKPFDKNLPDPIFVCFSERSMTFFYRVDLFDCMKKNKNNN